MHEVRTTMDDGRYNADWMEQLEHISLPGQQIVLPFINQIHHSQTTLVTLKTTQNNIRLEEKPEVSE